METSSHHEKELVLAQILYLYVIPTLLLYYKLIPDRYDYIVLFIVALLMYGIIKRAHWSYLDLGIRKDFLKDIIPYTIFTIAGVGFIVWISKIIPDSNNKPLYEWWENARFLLLFIPISVLQEVIFRGILMKLLLQAFSNPIFIIVLNASVFALIHIIYLNSTLILPLTFTAGIGFAWMYYRYPNLILISISHTILNFTAMILGFFILR
ncbi:MAG: CPBP family intramembrane metalloprotease [Patescibacteria group bacterium]|nr:CPBP family intramembrane metalloprotease [Patescibacteria group bacterium]